MKKLMMVIAFLICAINLYAQTQVSGTIDSQIWTKDKSPYLVVGDIKVLNLQIQPGVTILFNGNYLFEVAGVLKAIGTVADSIVFTKNSGVTGWKGILLNFVTPETEFAYCKIEFSTKNGIYLLTSLPRIRNCKITNNSAAWPNDGGGLYISGGSNATLTNCIFTNNSAYYGGGVYVSSGAIATFNNCIFAYNGASVGDGISNAGKAFLTNCVVAFNNGDGIYSGISVSTLTMINSIVFFNTERQLVASSTSKITYSDVQGGLSGEGNIDQNPIFNSGSIFTIWEKSPCVDAGNPDSSYFDTFFPPSYGTQRNDMGAYGGPGAGGWLTSSVEPPPAPSLAFPHDDSTGLTINPTLSWNGSIRATSYQVQLSTNPNFSPTARDTSGITVTSVMFSGLTNNTLYFWSVRASNAGGLSDWSNIWKFTTIVAKPTVPVLVSPTDGSGGIVTNPTLRWNASDRATSYHVQVAKNPNFSPAVQDTSGITGTEYNLSGLELNIAYYWRIRASSIDGTSDWSNIWRFTTRTTAVSERGNQIPIEFLLGQNYPNPFNPSTTIWYTLPKTVNVKLTIFNPLGREIETLVSGTQIAGEYKIQWSPENLTSGIYVYRLQAAQFVKTRKMILLR